ncbi:MAG: trypsin-like peptidase domain-containing protein [Planctomycetes bacterium]|nr:trypsin-like peptidase domain-containing protein [Planctomycetota bacterium]
MPSFRLSTVACLIIACVPKLALPQEKKTVEQLAVQAKESVAVILYTGRDGKQQGLGTGFVISADGLIATNFHVIGEARPITVQLADGSRHEATTIHASDRKLDLAIVKIDAKKKLKPLVLGDSTKLKQGQAIVALGHPRGLEYSVVAGVLSGKRDFDGVSMLQLAIPIEQGNSGGPILDAQGRVLGIVTMKSLVTNNLGFAIPINALKKILSRPNPIAMEQWLTIGALDKTEWQTLHGGRWRQRAGRILAGGTGTGFGGRTLCLSQRKPPAFPYEITVTVKLDDEAGAAGLIFGGDGADKHYGFYPTSGKVRLTRFDGPTVFSWKILHDEKTKAYRPGDWNTIKVRIEKNKFTCYINEEKITELMDPEYYGATVGLAKFRTTIAEFKKFQAATKVATSAISPGVRLAFEKSLPKIPLDRESTPKDLAPLLNSPADSQALLRARAVELDRQAEQLRKLAQRVHHERCLAELAQVFKAPDAQVDLARAALLVARFDNEELDVDFYRQEIDRLARQVSAKLPANAKPQAALAALNKFLFKERGFHGSHGDYYSRSNSYLNEVIDDREGLPITLSVLYLEIARRLKLNVVGVPLPGHFVVRHEPKKGEAQYVDVFDGKAVSRKEAEEKVRKVTGRAPTADDFAPASKKAIVIRMLHNLINVAESERDRAAMLRYLDGIVAIDADAHQERWARAVYRFQAGQRAGSLADCEYLLKAMPAGADLERVRELRGILEMRR